LQLLLAYLLTYRWYVGIGDRMAVSAVGEVGRSDQQRTNQSSERDDFLHIGSVLHVYEPDVGWFRQRLAQHQRREGLLCRRYAYRRSAEMTL